MIKIPQPWVEDPEAFETAHGLTVVDLLTVLEEMGPEVTVRMEKLAKVDLDAAASWAIAEAVKRGLLIDAEAQETKIAQEPQLARGA